MKQKQQGGCLCGHVRYEVAGEPQMTALCHCSYCRGSAGAPAQAWAMFLEGEFNWLGNEAAQYVSSDGVERHFCPKCGTQLAFTAEYIPGLIDITIASLDTPESYPPAMHTWDEKRLPWLQTGDDWPRHAGFPPQE